VQKADFDFSGPLPYLKHHSSDFMKVAFFDSRFEENENAWPIDTLKHRFIDRQSRLLGRPRDRF
jgi:hypothetical protein